MEESPLPFTEKQWSHTMRYDGAPVLLLTIHRPAFPDTGKTARLERYFSRLEQQWKQRWETVLYPKACHAKNDAAKNGCIFLPWQAKLNYQITLWHPPRISLRLDAEESALSGIPDLFCMGETWDCSAGYPCPLRSFFPPKAVHWRKILLDEIRSSAEQHLTSGESLLDPNCTQIMERTFDPDRFYLTEEGGVIFYPQGILGSRAEGIPTFPFSLPDFQTNTFSS